ncbi:MAG TPA: hypothetical protein VEA37_13575 [Flavobacterium sp.]|nr:hypothetical protein [Flavobacterium sp.]
MRKFMFQNEKLLKVWVWCLLKATHTEHEQAVGFQKVTLQPGQFVTGRYEAATELNMKPSTVWRYLNMLKVNNSVDIKSNTKFSVVTVVNWGFYQSECEKLDSEVDTNVDNKWTASGQQVDTNKNVKNDKNVKKIIYADHVKLTESEYQKLVDKFGEHGAKDWINRLSLYKGSTGKKYASDYMTILNWERKEQGKKPTTPPPSDKYKLLYRN